MKFQQWDGKQVERDHRLDPAATSELVRPMIEESAAQYAKEKGITPRDCSQGEAESRAHERRDAAWRAPRPRPRPCAHDRPARRSPTPTDAPTSSVNNIEVIYDHVILVLKGVSLEVPEGKIVALLGANGAGKTTTLKAISNLLRAERGDVTKGTIEFTGQRVDQLTPTELVQHGRVPGDGGPALLPAPDGRGEPADRRLHAQRRPRRAASATSRRSTTTSRA